MTFRGSKIILSAFPSPLCTPPFPWKATRNFSSSALHLHFTKENMSIQAHYSTWKIFLITTLPWSREMLMFPCHKRKDKPAARCHGDTATYWSLLETYNERGLFWKTFSSKLCDIRPVRQAFEEKLVLLETLSKFLPVNLLGSQHFPDCNRSTLCHRCPSGWAELGTLLQALPIATLHPNMLYETRLSEQPELSIVSASQSKTFPLEIGRKPLCISHSYRILH